MGILEVAKEMFINQGRVEGIEQGRAIGLERGEGKRNTVFVTNMLSLNRFSDKEIASLVDVPVAFVQLVRSDLKK